MQNALAALPAFLARQSSIGAVYYEPSLVNPHRVSVENNISLYAGLRILEQTLRAERATEAGLSAAAQARIAAALQSIGALINGGRTERASSRGLLSFFRAQAWQNGEFVQGGVADDPLTHSAWQASSVARAVDTNTWGIAALGTELIDRWFGFGAAFGNWQRVKSWGAYGVGQELWGVGYSDLDGNGQEPDGRYRQGILSAEWTGGAITMVRNMIHYYEHLSAADPNRGCAVAFLKSLRVDEQALYRGMRALRVDRYLGGSFPGMPPDREYLRLFNGGAYLYASKRYWIPFGWYANPLPSTCATAWAIMVADRFDPLGFGGAPN